jgi:hypothetical protein
MHEHAISALSSSFVGGKYEPDDNLPETLFRQRKHFLDEALLPTDRLRHYRRLAADTYRRDTIGLLWRQIGIRRNRVATLRKLVALARSDLRMLFVPGVLMLLASLVIGRPIGFLKRN